MQQSVECPRDFMFDLAKFNYNNVSNLLPNYEPIKHVAWILNRKSQNNTFVAKNTIIKLNMFALVWRIVEDTLLSYFGKKIIKLLHGVPSKLQIFALIPVFAKVDEFLLEADSEAMRPNARIAFPVFWNEENIKFINNWSLWTVDYFEMSLSIFDKVTFCHSQLLNLIYSSLFSRALCKLLICWNLPATFFWQ